MEAGRRAAEPLLLELRAAGFAAYDLNDFAGQRLPSKRAAKILVRWLGRVDDPRIDLFRQLPNDARAQRQRDRVRIAQTGLQKLGST